MTSEGRGATPEDGPGDYHTFGCDCPECWTPPEPVEGRTATCTCTPFPYNQGYADALAEVTRQLSVWQSDPGINTAIVVVRRMAGLDSVMTPPARPQT